MDDDPTQRGPSREALIVDGVADTLRMLAKEPHTPHARELAAQARSYEVVVKRWAAVPPTNAQVEAMLDLVMELHAKVVATRNPR